MQDVFLYAVIMFYCHWLIKKLIWSITRQSRARQVIQAEIHGEGWSHRAVIQLTRGKKCPGITDKPWTTWLYTD